MDVEAVIGPVVESAGLELVEVTFRREAGSRILRVTVDREDGVDLDLVAEVSERVSRRLDLEGFGPGPYSLEVSSPGLERPLNTARQFERAVGRIVKVKTVELVEGSRVHQGALVSADAEAIVVATAGGERRIPYAGMASARTVVDWDAELKRSSA